MVAPATTLSAIDNEGSAAYGGAGNDQLSGGLSSDYLDGGSGNDSSLGQ